MQPSQKTWRRLIDSRSFEKLNPLYVASAALDKLCFEEWQTVCDGVANNTLETSEYRMDQLIKADAMSEYAPHVMVQYWMSQPCVYRAMMAPMKEKEPSSARNGNHDEASCVFQPWSHVFSCINLDERFVSSTSSRTRYTLLQDVIHILHLFPMGIDTHHIAHMIRDLHAARRRINVQNEARAARDQLYFPDPLLVAQERSINAIRTDIHRKMKRATFWLNTHVASCVHESQKTFPYYDVDAIQSPIVCLFDSPRTRWLILPKCITPFSVASIVNHLQLAVAANAPHAHVSLRDWQKHGGCAKTLFSLLILYYWNRQIYRWHAQALRLVLHPYEQESKSCDDRTFCASYADRVFAYLVLDARELWQRIRRSLRPISDAYNAMIQQATLDTTHKDCVATLPRVLTSSEHVLSSWTIRTMGVSQRHARDFDTFWYLMRVSLYTSPLDAQAWYLRTNVDAYFPHIMTTVKLTEKYAGDKELQRRFKASLRARKLYTTRVGLPQVWASHTTLHIWEDVLTQAGGRVQVKNTECYDDARPTTTSSNVFLNTTTVDDAVADALDLSHIDLWHLISYQNRTTSTKHPLGWDGTVWTLGAHRTHVAWWHSLRHDPTHLSK